MAAAIDFTRLIDLAAERSSDKRRELLRGVTDMFLAEIDRAGTAESEAFDRVACLVSDQVATEDRAELAERLGPVAKAPHGIIKKLASDDSPTVAAPVLSQSPVLTDTDLVEITEDKTEDHRLAISQRLTVSEAVTDSLTRWGHAPVLRSVSANKGARFSEAGAMRLVERGAGDPEVLRNIGQRSDLPLSADMAAPAATDGQKPRDIDTIIQDLMIKFAELSGLHPKKIKSLILSGKPDILAVMARAAGLTREDLERVLHFRLQRTSESGGVMAQTLSQFDLTPADAARRVARFLKVRQSTA